VVAVAIIAGVVASLITTYVLLRVDPSTVLSSCSPIHSCSSPVNPWGVWLQIATAVLGTATVGTLLIRRRRGRPSVPISN
jgi:hypothetical protein